MVSGEDFPLNQCIEHRFTTKTYHMVEFEGFTVEATACSLYLYEGHFDSNGRTASCWNCHVLLGVEDVQATQLHPSLGKASLSQFYPSPFAQLDSTMLIKQCN
jgi:hypothetical protein